jgi:hypothetical protein
MMGKLELLLFHIGTVERGTCTLPDASMVSVKPLADSCVEVMIFPAGGAQTSKAGVQAVRFALEECLGTAPQPDAVACMHSLHEIAKVQDRLTTPGEVFPDKPGGTRRVAVVPRWLLVVEQPPARIVQAAHIDDTVDPRAFRPVVLVGEKENINFFRKQESLDQPDCRQGINIRVSVRCDQLPSAGCMGGCCMAGNRLLHRLEVRDHGVQPHAARMHLLPGANQMLCPW